MRVAAVSCITNLAAGRSKSKLSHKEVLEAGEAARPATARLLEDFTQLYGEIR
jgi:purine nucleoside phosphorylase